jgi:hypothetical protein
LQTEQGEKVLLSLCQFHLAVIVVVSLPFDRQRQLRHIAASLVFLASATTASRSPWDTLETRSRKQKTREVYRTAIRIRVKSKFQYTTGFEYEQGACRVCAA